MTTGRLGFVDLETTGLDCKKHTVIEVCVDLCTPYPELRTIKKLNTKITLSSEDLARAEPKALEINGYTQEKWASARTDLEEVWKEVYVMLDGNIPVGHYVDFDLGFIGEQYERFGIAKNYKWHRNKLDTKVFAIMFGHLFKANKYNLQFAHSLTGLKPHNAHTAEGDVNMCKDLYFQAMKYFEAGHKTFNSPLEAK